MRTLEIRSTAFDPGGRIPSRYTCDGEDISPPLSWTADLPKAAAYALIVDDPDAPMGTWVHWVAWNIPNPSFAEGIPTRAELEGGTRQGLNSWGKTGYGGPCPPSGEHRYFFKVYALDSLLDLPSSTDAAALSKAMKRHVLAQGEIIGRYSREKRR